MGVASFLIFDLDVDWRRGADWFESMLIDYDVTANWCNWVFAAGLTGGRINRFNVLRQAKNYDPDGAYVKHWLPELAEVPTRMVHEPWLLSESQRSSSSASSYPEPCIDPNTFPSAAGPTPVQLKGRGKGSPAGASGRGGNKGSDKNEKKATSNAEASSASADKKSQAKPQLANADGAEQPFSRRRWKQQGKDEPANSSAGPDCSGPKWLAG